MSRRPTHAALEAPKVGLADHALAFVVPMTAYVKVNFVGQVFGQDAIAFLLLPILALRPDSYSRLRVIAPVFWMLSIWLASQIVTDLVRDTPPQDYIRGWTKITFLGVQTVVLWLLLSRKASLFLSYFAGAGIEAILAARHLDYPFSLYPWKFGIGLGVILLAGVIGSSIVKDRGSWSVNIGPFLLFSAGLIVLFEGARSTFGSAVMAASYLAISNAVRVRPRLSRLISPARFGLFVIGGLGAAQLFLGAYGSLAASGALGDEAEQKYEVQSSGDVSLLQGGRVETLVSLQAIEDSPIIGHGSWARDMYYVRLLAERMEEKGLRPTEGSEGQSDLIPTHSHLFGAWVEAGIAGATFWAWMFYLCVAALYRLLKFQALPGPIVCVVAFTMLWDILFSPFGAEVRFIRAAEIAVLFYVLKGSVPLDRGSKAR